MGDDPTPVDGGEDTKRCPACAEFVKAEALICRFCGHDFRSDVVGRSSVKTPMGFEGIGGALLMAIASGLVILGAFGTWIKLTTAFGSVSLSGIDGGSDGAILVILGVVVLIIAVMNLTNTRVRTSGNLAIGGATIGVLVLLATVADYADISGRVKQANASGKGIGSATIGWGIWTLFIGGALVIIGAVILARTKKEVLATDRDSRIEGYGGRIRTPHDQEPIPIAGEQLHDLEPPSVDAGLL